PFPQQEPNGITKQAFYSQYRKSILSKSGFAVFVSGNRLQAGDNAAAIGKGVLEEFEIGTQLGTIPIPFGASGWAALEIWQKVSREPGRYFGATDISAPLKILGDAGRGNDEYIGAIFEMVQ